MEDLDFRNKMVEYACELRKEYSERTGPMRYSSISPYTASKHEKCSIKYITECADAEQAFVSFITWAFAQR
jgi:hypothetical protein